MQMRKANTGMGTYGNDGTTNSEAPINESYSQNTSMQRDPALGGSVKFLPLKKVKKLRNEGENLSRSRDDLKRSTVTRDLKNTNISLAMPAFLLGDELIISKNDISRYAKPAKLQVIISEKKKLLEKTKQLEKSKFSKKKTQGMERTSNYESRRTQSKMMNMPKGEWDKSFNLPEMHATNLTSASAISQERHMLYKEEGSLMKLKAASKNMKMFRK